MPSEKFIDIVLIAAEERSRNRCGISNPIPEIEELTPQPLPVNSPYLLRLGVLLLRDLPISTIPLNLAHEGQM